LIIFIYLKETNGMIIMTKEFDILNEQEISTDNAVESEFVNVGWGSFDTQFKGSAGKKAVLEKVSDNFFFQFSIHKF
jgi:hypothetical protein